MPTRVARVRSTRVASHRHRATLANVATEAGVSVTTASYVLNGRAAEMRISADATLRVERAAKSLAYRPNRNARSLRTSHTTTLGVISDHLASGSYSSRMLSGASAAARAGDHLVVIGETEGDRKVERALIDELLDRQVDGFLYATRTYSEVSVPRSLRQHDVVLLNCVDRQGRLPAVVPDELGAGRLAGRAMVNAGRTNVYLVGEGTTPEALPGQLRTDGLLQVLHESGQDLAGTVECPWDVHPARDAVRCWLGSGARPDGLVCLNDRVAMGVYQALTEQGLRIPDDVAVVSFDGSELADWLQPRLTSIALPFTEMGARAVDLLLDDDRMPDVVRLPMTLQAGGSV